jgi:hypothetical protein
VSKVRDSVYPMGRTNDWVKKTCAQRETRTIAGFATDGTKWDGLYVGRRKGGERWQGRPGFDKASAADLRKRLEPLVRKTQAFAKRIAHNGVWVEPKLWPRSSTGRSLPREKSGTRSFEGCGKICDAISARRGGENRPDRLAWRSCVPLRLALARRRRNKQHPRRLGLGVFASGRSNLLHRKPR